jgi:hypothetical protein
MNAHAQTVSENPSAPAAKFVNLRKTQGLKFMNPASRLEAYRETPVSFFA